ncbi:hypothetical protein SH501x_002106 [Pirellulaceae bacterium SH501]
MDIKKKMQIARSAQDASVERFIRSTVTLFDTKDNFEVGSGSLIRIVNRFFIITAGHIIKKDADKRIWAATRKERCNLEGLPTYLAYNMSVHPDVGYLEIDPQSATDYFFDSDFLGLSDLMLVGPGRENHLINVVGSPAQRVTKQATNDQSTDLLAGVQFFQTTPLEVSRWPNVFLQYPLDEAIDFLIEYPDNDEMTKSGFPPINLPDPFGLSGGGVWDMGMNEGKVWGPSSSRLVAIQSSWWRKLRILRAVQIKEWLKLVVEDYSDIREAVFDQFPGQFSSQQPE